MNAPAARCPICGERHANGETCPYGDLPGGGGESYAPLSFSMDPYAALDPQNQIGMQQLAAQGEQTKLLAAMYDRMNEQSEEIKRLRAHVERVSPRQLPGRAAPALPRGRCGTVHEAPDGSEWTCLRPDGHAGGCSIRPLPEDGRKK